MNVAGYVRLSRDEDKGNYSSIEAQQEIIYHFAIKNNLIVKKIYIDDNYSGYTFNRPAFREMHEELKKGKIDVIIAKDLSRIGRHNARTQLFLEEVQERGKRVLLPEEGRGYDSVSDDDDIIGIKTWYNERYVKDISRKIKAAIRARQRKGDLIMGNPYGYAKDPAEKSKLVVDENVRPIIELIFKLYIEGKGYLRICNILDSQGFMTPSMYCKDKHLEKGRVFKNAVSKKWQTHNINRIITNDLYIGTLRTHMRQNRNIKGKQERVPEDEQFVFENHHEAIISKEDFSLVQQINRRRKTANYRGKAKYDYIFSSFVFCGDCGFTATGRNIGRRPDAIRGYECTQYAKYGRKRCVCHSVPESRLLSFFKAFLQDVREQYHNYLSTINIHEKKRNLDHEIARLKKELDEANGRLKMLITQKVRDVMKEKDPEYRKIIEGSYIELEKEELQKICVLSRGIETVEKVIASDAEENALNAIGLYDKATSKDSLDRKLIEMVLEKIFIYRDGSIEFKLLADINEFLTSSTSCYLHIYAE